MNFIENNRLITKGEKVLLAVSGGIDSVILAHLFDQSSIDFGIAHCNFQLRGEESDGDEAFVKSLAKRIKKPFYCKHFDTKTYANNNGISTQMAARDLRYSWFSELQKEEGYAKITTAHHLNDAIETTLFNFSKGTGISGIRGLKPINEVLIRPLLFASRLEIETYAKAQGIKWREDSSNKEDTYARNHIRLTVIPELRKINSSLESTAVSTFERLLDVEKIFKHEVAMFKNTFVKTQHNLTTIIMSEASGIIGFPTILHDVLKAFGFNFSQTKEIIKRKNESGKLFLSTNFQLNIDRDTIFITSRNKEEETKEYKIQQGDTSIALPHGRLTLDWDAKRPSSFSRNDKVTFVDIAKLRFPLIVRKWKEGDSFEPLGMKNKKKMSDFLIDRKIPLHIKEQIYVLESENKIVWVVGHQLDERFKLSNNTSGICYLEFTPL
ncbi:MAG: tRNA lysidine(34) synthetase TilS [Cyclobacteriaceae bacterium]|nr:tRNA lysidine(34) synthetase TilS [Cyclobacteriaceae bacterium]